MMSYDITDLKLNRCSNFSQIKTDVNLLVPHSVLLLYLKVSPGSKESYFDLGGRLGKKNRELFQIGMLRDSGNTNLLSNEMKSECHQLHIQKFISENSVRIFKIVF